VFRKHFLKKVHKCTSQYGWSIKIKFNFSFTIFHFYDFFLGKKGKKKRIKKRVMLTSALVKDTKTSIFCIENRVLYISKWSITQVPIIFYHF
jgi:hypothetical protein